MGIFDTIRKAISLEEDDDDSLYEEEMKELERKERANNNRRSARNIRVEEEGKEESGTSRRGYRSSISSRKNNESGKSAGQIAQERRATTSTRKLYEGSRMIPPRSPEVSYSSQKSRNDFSSQRNSDDNVVKIKRDSSDISIIKVQSFTDAQEVCDNLIDGRPIIVSFENPKSSESQRIMDFIAGCIYVINGNLHTISDSIFLFSPKGVDVSGDYLNMVQNNGFGIPTFNKML